MMVTISLNATDENSKFQLSVFEQVHAWTNIAVTLIVPDNNGRDSPQPTR
jgi:hypothetical protein